MADCCGIRGMTLRDMLLEENNQLHWHHAPYHWIFSITAHPIMFWISLAKAVLSFPSFSLLLSCTLRHVGYNQKDRPHSSGSWPAWMRRKAKSDSNKKSGWKIEANSALWVISHHCSPSIACGLQAWGSFLTLYMNIKEFHIK